MHARTSSLVSIGAALLLGVPLLVSCGGDLGVFRISGRLGSSFGCLTVPDDGRNYEVRFGRQPLPPLGSQVTLLVRGVGGASGCMVGPIVDVVTVMSIRTDFRTAPIIRDEVWGPGGAPIVLGKVEVKPGVTLTILPGTVVQIIAEGELRVRGKLIAEGTPADSIRFVGSSAWPSSGPIAFDSADTTSRMSYCTATAIDVSGPGPVLAHLRAAGLSVTGGQATLLLSSVLGVSGWNDSKITLADVDARSIDGVSASFSIDRCTLQDLTLSYSQASVRDSRFAGPRSYLLFHGASGGRIEHNVFEAVNTTIAFRHTSDPEFHDNDFVSRVMSVVCESYQRPDCLRMEQNWWGSADEAHILAIVENGCPVCYTPWRTSPAFPRAS